MSVRKKITKIVLTQPKGTDLYLFGSVLYSKNFKDIDLAIIYDKSIVDIDSVINFRRELKKLIIEKFKMPCGILLLSTEEEQKAHFLINAKYEKIELQSKLAL